MHRPIRSSCLAAGIGILSALLGCTPAGEHGDNRSLQNLREKIITEFATNPDGAFRQYSPMLGSGESDIQTSGAKAIICGQLSQRGFPDDPRCGKFLEQAVLSDNFALRAIGVSAHAFLLDEDSQDILFAGLSDRSEKVRREAIMAIEFQFDTLTADPNDPTAGDRLRARLVEICPTIRSGGSLYSEPCRKAESRSRLRQHRQ